MEYSKDIIIGIKNTKEEDKQHTSKKVKIINFMNNHKFIASISITCITLMMLDCALVYSFIELLKRL